MIDYDLITSDPVFSARHARPVAGRRRRSGARSRRIAAFLIGLMEIAFGAMAFGGTVAAVVVLILMAAP
ncbi:MAG: hypothetical protein ACKVS5_02695 [Parvularculaceae bacterium]